ncbi:DUF2062 domain-containing protein [Desulfopila sp. IMCC35008]|uniref:DUF2062 domain-containing protein n=1 Tax=Desulfopila sp. IMCC35008 TaxID=2653858 RepID=UPI0013D1E3C3|nr:DUF2062 domain-containing protein [Desulfopila sp. IMCC35008]
MIKWLVRLRRSPRSIAGGFALGTFIALTPTFGIQLFLVLAIATVINVNRAAAMLTVWVTNVATIAPIYTFNYWVGSLFWEGPAVREVYAQFLDLAAKLVTIDIWAVLDQFRVVMALGQEIIIPLVIGSVIVGFICAALVYLISMVVIRFILVKRQRKKQLL